MWVLLLIMSTNYYATVATSSVSGFTKYENCVEAAKVWKEEATRMHITGLSLSATCVKQ